MTTLAELIERLEKAEAGSRELDWLIADALGEIPEHRVMETGWDYVWYRKPGEFALWKATDSEGRSVDLWQAPQRSTSIDAAVALAERVLPGWDYAVESFGEDGAHAKVWKHGWHDDTVVRADARAPALALILATLKALEATR